MTVTSFAVGSVFEIIDKATPTLERLSRQVSAFNKLLDTSKKSLLELGNTKFPGLETSLKALGDPASGPPRIATGRARSESGQPQSRLCALTIRYAKMELSRRAKGGSRGEAKPGHDV